MSAFAARTAGTFCTCANDTASLRFSPASARALERDTACMTLGRRPDVQRSLAGAGGQTLGFTTGCPPLPGFAALSWAHLLLQPRLHLPTWPHTLYLWTSFCAQKTGAWYRNAHIPYRSAGFWVQLPCQFQLPANTLGGSGQWLKRLGPIYPTWRLSGYWLWLDQILGCWIRRG